LSNGTKGHGGPPGSELRGRLNAREPARGAFFLTRKLLGAVARLESPAPIPLLPYRYLMRGGDIRCNRESYALICGNGVGD